MICFFNKFKNMKPHFCPIQCTEICPSHSYYSYHCYSYCTKGLKEMGKEHNLSYLWEWNSCSQIFTKSIKKLIGAPDNTFSPEIFGG